MHGVVPRGPNESVLKLYAAELAAEEAYIVRRQSFWDNGLAKLREALAHRCRVSGSLQSMLQAAVGHSLSLDPLSLCQDGGPAPEVDVGWGEIVDALVITAVGVVVEEGGGLGVVNA